ncbi:MAG: hypothetical protein E7610_04480 [Ruminococcaceae bacterium]|nr:hypothetical protein [Oscillospiraceae bacterium]
MKQRNTQNHTDLAGSKMSAAQKKKVRMTHAQRKAARKAAKEAILPVHKRPVVCPPDKAGRGVLFRAGGLVCRALVIWLAAAGLVIFVAGALEFGVPNSVIFLVTLAVVALAMIFRLGWVGKLISLLAGGGALAGLFLTMPKPTDLLYGCLSLYNAALDRLYKVGYLVYVQYKVTIATSTPHEELMILGVGVLSVLISALFALCFVKKVRIVPPAIVATTILTVLLTFNIYSNRIQSNLGIALVIVSFASMLVMTAYDRLYHKKDEKQYDTELKLFCDDDRPTMPAEYTRSRADRDARKRAKAEARARRREKTVTVEEELTDYFGGKKKAPKKKLDSDARSRKEKRRETRAMMKQVRAVRAYDRVTEQARTAMGGYAAAAVLLASLIAIALPALTIKENFNTIDAIDEKMALARDYVTALLRGDDNALDRLEYKADSDNFKPHSTELEQLEFTGKQIFYIQSRYMMNYYLRGWIGTDYENGAWLAVDDEILQEYQAAFGKDSSPSEELKYLFYHFMKPELVDDPEYTENLLTKRKDNQAYGFVNLLVSLRRVNSPSTLTYFPATFDPRYGLMEYNSTEDHTLTFVNYYDGLYTGRNFHKNGVAYSTVSYATIMKDRKWIQRQAALQAAYALQKEALLARTGFVVSTEGGVNSYLTLEVQEQKNGMTLFMYTYKRGSTEQIWRFYHDTDQVYRPVGGYEVRTPYGTLILETKGNKVVGVNVTDVGSEQLDAWGTPVDVNLMDDYNRQMTDEERAELMSFITMEKDYGDFVYATYLKGSESLFLRELAATIRAQAHAEEERVTEELIPDDPETPEDDSYTVRHKEIVNIPADVSLAAVRNSSDPNAYVQRDLLVRNVIDYIIDEMGCTYTITPDLSTVDPNLDGVENFLKNTKEGYCVQFASAAALILRELDIPVRYVEGYLGNDLTKISREDFVYGAYVRDYQAHAWIEVWYDGVGWIQYETTPQYYVGMYGAENSAGSTPIEPIFPEDDTDPIPDETEPETLEPGTEELDTSEETTDELSANTEEVLRNSLIVLGVMVALAAAAAVIATVVNRARAAEDHRQSVAAQILESRFGTNTAESDRRELALEMADAVMTLLTLYDLSPATGEFREDYADRLTEEFTKVPDKDKKVSPEAIQLPNLHVVLDGMAAEEFGHGMSISEMKATALCYLFLHGEVRKRLAWPERFVLRYFKHKI